jgi:hypothetical protein
LVATIEGAAVRRFTFRLGVIVAIASASLATAGPAAPAGLPISAALCQLDFFHGGFPSVGACVSHVVRGGNIEIPAFAVNDVTVASLIVAPDGRTLALRVDNNPSPVIGAAPCLGIAFTNAEDVTLVRAVAQPGEEVVVTIPAELESAFRFHEQDIGAPKGAYDRITHPILGGFYNVTFGDGTIRGIQAGEIC